MASLWISYTKKVWLYTGFPVLTFLVLTGRSREGHSPKKHTMSAQKTDRVRYCWGHVMVMWGHVMIMWVSVMVMWISVVVMWGRVRIMWVSVMVIWGSVMFMGLGGDIYGVGVANWVGQTGFILWL